MSTNAIYDGMEGVMTRSAIILNKGYVVQLTASYLMVNN